MSIQSLSAEQQDIILRCLRATAAYVDDWEKHARLGLEPEELQALIAVWPNVDESTQTGLLAIDNCLNEVANGFRIAPDDWPKWFNVPLSEVRKTYGVWLVLKGTRREIA